MAQGHKIRHEREVEPVTLTGGDRKEVQEAFLGFFLVLSIIQKSQKISAYPLVVPQRNLGAMWGNKAVGDRKPEEKLDANLKEKHKQHVSTYPT